MTLSLLASKELIKFQVSSNIVYLITTYIHKDRYVSLIKCLFPNYGYADPPFSELVIST